MPYYLGLEAVGLAAHSGSPQVYGHASAPDLRGVAKVSQVQEVIYHVDVPVP